MRDDLDVQIGRLLSEWHVPAPSDYAVSRIIDAAQTPPARALAFRRPAWLAAPALAASALLGVMLLTPHPIQPKAEPLLAQSALNVFSVPNQSSEAEELP